MTEFGERDRPCEKVRYPSSSKANRALQTIRERGHRGPDNKKPVRAYPCGHCRGYHLTSEL